MPVCLISPDIILLSIGNERGGGNGLLYKVTFAITFFLISLLSIKLSTVKSASGFSVADRSLDYTGVSWVIIGTLVGGISTIGTVQTAYTHGISAWIFTLGSGVSCLLLGLFFAKGLREAGVVTVSEYLGRAFGNRFRSYCSIVNSVGMFIHIIGQFLASIAILQAVFHFSAGWAVLLTSIFIGVFVINGGIAGAGLIGKIKFFLLYIIMLVSAGVALYRGGGLENILSCLPPGADMLSLRHYGLQAASVHMASMVVGVLSTQIYLQAIFSAGDVKEARNGAFLSAAVIPPLGLLGIVIGLYLRANFSEISGGTAQALPFFLYHSFPPLIAAFFSAGILLVVLGTGAGLLLGVTTNIYNDFIDRKTKEHHLLKPLSLLRALTLFILFCAAMLVFTGLDSAILKWSYMSMGLRGSAVFVGLVILVFFKKLSRSRWVVCLLYLIPVVYVLMNINLVGES